jgi:hypothetical protein
MLGRMMKIAIQQPQFLPWVGVWHKYLSADLYVVYAGVKFNQYDYQHRVRLHDSWITLPVKSHSRNLAIKNVKVADISCLKKIARRLRQELPSKKYPHVERMQPILTALESYTGSDYLLDINHHLFLIVRNILGLQTELTVDDEERPDLSKTEKIDDCLAKWSNIKGWREVIYLSGVSGLEYLANAELLTPIKIQYQQVLPTSPEDTVVKVIALEDNPTDIIRNCAFWSET